MGAWYEFGIAGVTPINDFAAADGDLAMGTNKITGMGDGTADTDAATVGQMNALVQGLNWIEPVRVLATANVDISTELENLDVLDGVTLATGDRVMLSGQSTAAQDGVYIVVASGAASRSADVPTGHEARNMTFWVNEGTANADTGWTVTNDEGSDVIGTDGLTIVNFGVAGLPTASEGVKKVGNDFRMDVATLTLDASPDVADSIAFYDTTEGLHNRMTFTNLVSFMEGANGPNHDNLEGFVADEHLDWKTDQGADNIHVDNIASVNEAVVTAHEAALSIGGAQVDSGTLPDARIQSTGVTQHEGDIDHNALTNFEDDQHEKILAGTTAARGTAAAFGVGYYWDTDNGTWHYSNGTAWQDIVATAASHASTHASGQADEVDGDVLDIDWNPTYYTPAVTPTEVTSVDELTAHLYGIDQAFNGKQPLDADLTSWAGVTRAANFDTYVATPTLANLNAFMTGSDLIDTDDSRLTDDRDPTSHAFAGADHSASALADLNSKVNDLMATYGAVRDIGVGTTAQRPAAGTVGRFWWSTDEQRWFMDDGASWDGLLLNNIEPPTGPVDFAGQQGHDFVMDTYADASARDVAIASPVEGHLVILQSTDRPMVYLNV